MEKFRLLHTADWHLGHLLNGQPRDYEQQVFLDWLLTVLQDEQIDALLVAGDVFDDPHPPARSLQCFYRFLAAAKARLPMLDIIILGGNHDSAALLEASHPVLAAFGVRIIGGLALGAAEGPKAVRCQIKLHGSNGNPTACLAAVPYLRPRDLPLPHIGEDANQKMVESIGSVYSQVIEEVRREAGQDMPSIVAGHVYVAGCHLSEDSERKIQNAYLAALPADIFHPQLSYVALGHLHLAQQVSNNIFYSGSPLPLSFAETDYCHQVLVVEFDGPRLAALRSIPVPLPVPLLRLPADGPQPPEQVLQSISRLEQLEGRDRSSAVRPYLEVRVRLEARRATLGEEIHRALKDKWPRLLKITLEQAQPQEHPASTCRSLDELNQEEIFLHCYRRRYSSATSILDVPGDQLMEAFRLLWEEQERGELR
jgi:DNA repair protein SbcD/Mre11